ncbi:methionine synthase [uncultured Muribaculum sp.]|uniref:methionine synthase n=1 Tax=uncultured Muribaculum sp. TaxID=1918613 RepID=UPI0025DAEECB|nr:methionine synthase [uncultured Muribaculum sp.]
MAYIDSLKMKDASMRLVDSVSERILVLDGAMGTMIQGYSLTEDDFRGEGWAKSAVNMKGCNDLLCITRPDVISEIHTAYLESGAQIIETDSFNANAFSLAEYGLEHEARRINLAAAGVARDAADRFMGANPGTEVWVAGSVGPTSKSLSMAQSIDGSDSAFDWDALVHAYSEQMEALIDGGVDLLIIETVFDALNAKAAIYAARRAMEQAGVRVPLMISVTLTESGRTLSGQTLEAFVTTVAHAEPLAVGLNCGFGADGMMQHLETLSRYPFAVSVYPNAGLPNEMGQYDETPAVMGRKIRRMMERGLVNIVGGCCGTTPDHIREFAGEASRYAPRRIPAAVEVMTLAGLEAVEVSPSRNFLNVGERCNVAGSRKFLRLIKDGALQEAVDIARTQVENGAQVVDVNMDDGLLDIPAEMSRFISRLGAEPDVARVPVMVDSSSWDAVMAGLKRIQGRPVVNSISLKEGEEKFLEHARDVREMDAAVVVMAFDEQGQAVTFERRTEVCARAYRLLTEKAGIRPCDIIFDPNVLAVGAVVDSGDGTTDPDELMQSRRSALDFLRTIEWIKANLPGAKVSGGISNLSYAFRANKYVRKAMHGIFLNHAIKLGMDMAIVNAAEAVPLDDIPPRLREAIDDLLLYRRDDATERLMAVAAEMTEAAGNTSAKDRATGQETTPSTPSGRLRKMIERGVTDGIESVLAETLAELGAASSVIDGPLMEGMDRVGTLFGEGKLFLPQVVKSAHAMKRAVGWLTPHIESESTARSAGMTARRSMVIATVKGDVHDIGKNIVATVLRCNGLEVTDLGVMVPAAEIVDRAEADGASFIGLSGLITPSLEEMCVVARLMEERGMKIPLLVGGATTSALHTAVKIAPCYSGPVIHTRDAAMLPSVMKSLLDADARDAFLQTHAESQAKLRADYEAERLRRRSSSSDVSVTPEDALAMRPQFDFPVAVPRHPGLTDIKIPFAEARKLINWRAFMAAWGLDASLGAVAEIRGCDHCRAQWLASIPQSRMPKATEAMQLAKEAQVVLDYIGREILKDGIPARVALLPAGSRGDDIVVGHVGSAIVFPTLRRLAANEGETSLAMADFVKPLSVNGAPEDYIGVFAVTVGDGVESRATALKERGDDYRSLLYRTLADRLVEAATEWMHWHVRTSLWGYAPEEETPQGALLDNSYRGIRPAFGYPSLPDQSLIFIADKVLDYASMGITLTENGAMSPAASTSGLLLSHPQSRYFVIDRLDTARRAEYAARRGFTISDFNRFLPHL